MTMRRWLWFACAILLLNLLGRALGSDQAIKPFSLVVLPDIQYYTYASHHPNFKRSKRGYLVDDITWIGRNISKLNIAAVVQVGDISDQNKPAEYGFARTQFMRLYGFVPYMLVQGNHDMGFDPKAKHHTANNRNSHFDRYFPKSRYEHQPWFGGSMDQTLRNAWYKFERGGMKFMLIGLEYKPRDKAIAWANRVVSKHPGYRVIVFTHAFLRKSHRKPALWRQGHNHGLPGNDGQALWDKLIAKHDNIFMVLSGHWTGENHRVQKASDGHKVIEILTDYQFWKKGGQSWLRYLTFHPDQNKIKVFTYNPNLDKFKKNGKAHFTVDYDMTVHD